MEVSQADKTELAFDTSAALSAAAVDSAPLTDSEKQGKWSQAAVAKPSHVPIAAI